MQSDRKERADILRRGARAVELATLERWYTGNGIVGSNPTLSAIQLLTVMLVDTRFF